MALRFQKEDEVDRAVKEERHTGAVVFVVVFFAVIHGAYAWFRGESLESYEKDLAWWIGFGFVYWIVVPFYYEFRFRTKEIDGKVSAIEEAVKTSEARLTKMMEKLTAIERALRSRTGVQEGNRAIEDQEADDDEEDDSQEEEKVSDEELLAKYHASAERGEVWGQLCLGVTYYNGTRVLKDNVMAAFWFRKAAEQGDDEAQLHLAEILRSADGLPPDYGEALKWYRNLVERESTYRNIAEDRLGDMHANGEGVPKDYAEAARWWERAAEHGWTWGHYRLGELYARGEEGVPQDYNEAYFRLHVATEGKGLGVMQKSAIDERNKCANHLTPETLFQTQERAQKWLAAHQSKAQ